MNKEYVLILGAGPSGLGAALELHKEGKPFVIIEKNSQVGGLARTLQYGEFRTDIGPHRFFSQNQYLYELIEELLGEHLTKVKRLTKFYINGKFFLYPIELKNAFLNVGPLKALKILYDYLYQRVSRLFFARAPTTFEEYVVSEFGRTLSEFNILNYTEKIWGLPPHKISPDWASQRIKGLSLTALIKNVLISSDDTPKTMADQFLYPDLGAGLIYEKIKDKIIQSKNSFLRLNRYPVKIIHNENIIIEVVIKNYEDEQNISPKYLISSIPIAEFINLLSPEAPKEALEAAKNLRFRSHTSFFITLNKPSVFPEQWLYFPDKEIPFARITEPKNFSKNMSPKDKTSLLVEFFCWRDDKIWKASKEELFELTMKWLKKLNFIKANEVIEYFINKEKYAYPVYDLNYKENLKILKDYLSQFNNLLSIGRFGSFRYNNQDHALEMGMLAARSIIEGKRYDIESIGSGKEYFEKGYGSL